MSLAMRSAIKNTNNSFAKRRPSPCFKDSNSFNLAGSLPADFVSSSERQRIKLRKIMPQFTSQFDLHRGCRPFLILAGLALCLWAASSTAQGQVLPRPKKVDNPAPKPIIRRPTRVKQKIETTTPTTSGSDDFVELGDQFYQKGKFNAAEAAYKEALKLWSGNADAVAGLGYLYVSKGMRLEAQSQLSRLRQLDSAMASELAPEVGKLIGPASKQ
jgi:tetratricopeptide (TPR) repeat protein